MLTELKIENFAIIQNLELHLGSGLLTFTGETGAGKSIILDAIGVLLGGRTDNTMIRGGVERSLVEAVFELSPDNREQVHRILREEDLLDDPDSLTLARELRREGRSVARINGRSVSTSMLRELGSHLVDIHGQSEHLSLLNVKQHIHLLDRFAGDNTALKAFEKDYHVLLALRRELDELRRSEQDAARQIDMLQYQINEIEAAHLKVGEDDALRVERDRLANAENLASLVQQCLQVLSEGAPDSPSASDLAGQVVKALASLSRIDSSQQNLSARAEALAESIDEMVRDLQDYLEGIEFNPRRLGQAEERLELLRNLKRKYGGDIKAVQAYAHEARQKLEKITHAGERIEKLEKQEEELLQCMGKTAAGLSAQRQEAARALSQAVEGELSDLNMAQARFRVDFKRLSDPNGLPFNGGERVAFHSYGIDEVEFFIAPNPGEGFKPLVKIASGGETSRLMLALKNVLAHADIIPTLIFDEIDQGIGGRTGAVIGEKLWQLGRQHQVLCVTHLPQLAAFGDIHFRVGKQIEDGRTLTHVQKVEGQERLDELAQMLGSISEANRKAALQTLEDARQRKTQIP